jgi:NAD(P)-dependent dehydrogenase (short-subunit alcohol dehydrogenase family)
MEQKTIIITGANSGIGRAATYRFAKEGHNVIMGCRNIESGKLARDEISKATGNDRIYLEEVDMSSFDSIQRFSDRFKKTHTALDILINNAAYFNHGEKYQLSVDGLELTFATNVLGPFLLTRQLLDPLKISRDARVLNAGSNIIKHFFSPKKELELNNLKGENKDAKASHSVYRCYRDSKMALLMLTFSMAEEYKDFDIKVNALQINGARMSKETIAKFKPQWRPIAWIQNIFFPLPEFMADNYYEICTSEKFKNTTGKLINHRLKVMQVAQQNPGIKEIMGSDVYPVYAQRKDLQDKIWDLCLRLTSEKVVKK